MSDLNKALRIGNWQNAIADSPHLGFGLLKNVEIDSFPGAVRVGKKPVTAFHTAYSQTFTANAGTDVCTAASGTLPATGTAFQFTTTGTLPAGLSLNTNYFIINISPTTFKVATTIANALAATAIDITDAGSGVHTAATINPGTIRHYAVDPRTSTKFLIDSNGVVWYNAGGLYLVLSTNTAKTNAAGNGLAVFRVSDGSATYLFVFRNALVDVVNVFATANLQAPNWSYGWKSLNSAAGSGNSHHAIVGQDNIIYFTDDRYIGSILEKAGQVFDPTSGATYTFNNQALDLPLGSLCYWLEQLGVNLLISVSNDSFIYPWDRTSDSFGLPFPIGEYGGNKMKNIGNIVYILAGTRGNIYWTQGTYVRPFKTVPLYLTYTSPTPISNPMTWGGIAAVSGKLIVGVGANTGESGVFMFTPDGKMTIDNYPSTGQANVTALYAQNEFYDMGYAGGADTMDTSRYASLEAVLQSQLYQIGTKTAKAAFSQIEVQIASPVAGAIELSYRTALFASFVVLNGGVSITTDVSNTSYQIDCGLTNLENIQMQVRMSGTIDLMEVRLYK